MRIIILLFVFLSGSLIAQEGRQNQLRIGLEQDVLPYFLKGYIGTVWVGKQHLRGRFSYAEASSPPLLLADGISSDRVQAVGLSCEYFPKPEFSNWWFGPGIGYWNNSIANVDGVTVQNESWILTLGSGYQYFLNKRFYLSTWTALHTRITGSKEISVGGYTHKPMLVTPELSLKVGLMIPSL